MKSLLLSVVLYVGVYDNHNGYDVWKYTIPTDVKNPITIVLNGCRGRLNSLRSVEWDGCSAYRRDHIMQVGEGIYITVRVKDRRHEQRTWERLQLDIYKLEH